MRMRQFPCSARGTGVLLLILWPSFTANANSGGAPHSTADTELTPENPEMPNSWVNPELAKSRANPKLANSWVNPEMQKAQLSELRVAVEPNLPRGSCQEALGNLQVLYRHSTLLYKHCIVQTLYSTVQATHCTRNAVYCTSKVLHFG